MEEQIKKTKLRLRLSAIMVVITCATLVTGHRLNAIRTVDFLLIFASGIAFGVMLSNAFHLRRLKSGQ